MRRYPAAPPDYGTFLRHQLARLRSFQPIDSTEEQAGAPMPVDTVGTFGYMGLASHLHNLISRTQRPSATMSFDSPDYSAHPGPGFVPTWAQPSPETISAIVDNVAHNPRQWSSRQASPYAVAAQHVADPQHDQRMVERLKAMQQVMARLSAAKLARPSEQNAANLARRGGPRNF